MIKKIRENIFLIALILFSIGVFAVTARINIFRYNNFDFGKFDLGNMTQMVWYTLHGKPLYLTDYFGTNLPRWAMSHVDPILLIFVPVFALFQHPLTMVFSQIVLVMSGAFVLYKIGELRLNSKLAGALFGFAYLFYPAIGFLNAWTGFHGVTAVITFFLLAFYCYELMHKDNDFSTKKLSIFWLFLILTMMGKEQLPLYVVLYGVFIALFRFKKNPPIPKRGSYLEWIKSLALYKNVQIGLSMIIVGLIWFYLAFFVIIPAFASYRVEGYEKFANTIELNTAVATDVASDNYFISRYEAFGDTYTEVIIGMLSDPAELARVLFEGDKAENLEQTLAPMAYTSLLFPPIFMFALPDFLINYGTTAGGIGTSEIINHRISMIIPVLFLASIYGVGFVSDTFVVIWAWFVERKPKKSDLRKLPVKSTYIAVILSALILYTNIAKTYEYNNPIFLWLTQAVQKRVQVFAKEDKEVGLQKDIEIGDRFKLSALDNKDRECALKVVEFIPDEAAVTGPDYLGAHLSMRETYAIFPALYNEAEYVIVDIFSQKILRILDLDVGIVRDVVADIIKDPNYEMQMACGNLFVFKFVGPHDKAQILPLQERFEYPEVTDLEIFQTLTIVDYELPSELVRGKASPAEFVYVKRENARLDDYILFLSFINDETGEMYQVANLPSFALNQLRNWREDNYIIESLEIVVPEFIASGNYKVFIGMNNNIRTRSIYLGDIVVR